MRGVALVCALAVGLSVAYAFARAPHWDEGLYADVARQFALHNTLGSPLMGASGGFGFVEIPRMNERTYWTTPLYPVLVGLGFKAAGVGLVPMRLVTLASAVMLVAAWGAIVRRLTRSDTVALAAVALMAGSSHVLWGASMGRPEALGSGLAALGAALYLRWREANLLRAACAASALVAAGGLAHPLVAVEAVAFGSLALCLDFRRLRPRHLLAAAGTGLLVVSPWLLYVLQDVDTARAQLVANTQLYGGSRTAGLSDPLGALLSDFRRRYVEHTWVEAHGAARVLAAEFAVLLACCGLALASPAVRRRRGSRALALLAVVSWAALAILDTSNFRQYFLHVFPALIALAALAVCELARRGLRGRVAAAALAAGLTVPGLGGVSNRVAVSPYVRDYLGMTAAVRRYQRAGAQVTGGSELAFALGFSGGLRDDMGMRTPTEVYVQNEPFVHFTRGLPIRAVLARDYQVAFKNTRYRVFVRRPDRPLGPPSSVVGR